MDNSIIISDCESLLRKVDTKMLNHSSILISGASGLIGTYFLYAIKNLVEEQGYTIELNIITHRGLPEFLNEFGFIKWVKVYQGDISDINFLNEIGTQDFIIHAAGYAQPGKFLLNQDVTLKVNTLATFLLMEKLNKNGHFLFVSSSEIYSGSKNFPYNENEIGSTNTNHPRAAYIEGKRCGEAICNAYMQKDIFARSARLSLAYGPGIRRDDSRVLYNFIQKAIENKAIVLNDSGDARRTYCYVSDAVEMMLNILLHGSKNVYNVGGHSHTTILGLATTIGKLLDIPVSAPQFITDNTNGAPIDVSVDLNRYEEEFHKKEYINLADGLKKTINWYTQLLK